MKKIIIITTGGTIAMKKKEDGLAVPVVTGEDFLQALPELAGLGEIRALTWKNVPGAHLQLNDIVELAGVLKQFYEKGFDGAVITHGTDTMEESAYLLDLLFEQKMAVVLTGAQRNPSLPGNDGPANLLDAVLTATDPRSQEAGVLLVFNGEVHCARDVQKTHTSRLDTFKSPEFGPLAAITNMRVHWYRLPLIKEHYNIAEKLNSRIELVRCVLGGDDSLIKLALQNKLDGLIIEALGAGHVPPQMMTSIKTAVAKGLPVVLCSRCTGRLFTDTYGFAGSEKELREAGVIFGDALPGIKARLKLSVLLAAGFSTSEIKYHFEKNFYRRP